MRLRPRNLQHFLTRPIRLILLLLHYLWRLYTALARNFDPNQNRPTRSSTLNSYFCLILLLLATVVRLKLKHSEQLQLVVISTTYFATSTIYEPNTIVILLNGPRKLYWRQMKTFICISNNATHQKTSRPHLQYAYPPVDMCRWTAYVMHCPAVPNMAGLILADSSDILAEPISPMIHFRLPYSVGKKLEVCTCFSPFFYMERWQIVLASLEIYRHFGVQLGVIYVQSMLDEILAVLKLYQKRGFVELEPWPSIKMDLKSEIVLGFDPNTELDWRNQASAHTDCLLKYREATEFIIVGDIDDVLIPLGKSYFQEFHRLSALHSNAAGFIYRRFNTELVSSVRAKHFSLTNLMKSAKISDNEETGKYALNTSRTETAWLHWPGITVGHTKMHTVPVRLNIMLHLRNWTLLDVPFAESDEYWSKNVVPDELQTGSDWSAFREYLFWRPKDMVGLLKRHFLHSPKALARLEGQFETIRQGNEEIFRQLPSSQHYLPRIVDCYDRIFYSRGKRPNTCPGPIHCRLPKIQDLRCAVATTQTLEAVELSWRNLLHLAKEPAAFEIREDGCSLH